MYFFDKMDQTCKPFYYGGCGGRCHVETVPKKMRLASNYCADERFTIFALYL